MKSIKEKQAWCYKYGCDKPLFGDGKYSFRGYVEFKNGITEGTQRFEASNLGELYEKIVEFCKSLE